MLEPDGGRFLPLVPPSMSDVHTKVYLFGTQGTQREIRRAAYPLIQPTGPPAPGQSHPPGSAMDFPFFDKAIIILFIMMILQKIHFLIWFKCSEKIPPTGPPALSQSHPPGSAMGFPCFCWFKNKPTILWTSLKA